MVSDTRSTRKSTQQSTESPPSVRKSKCRENETPLSTPPMKRTSERLGKCNTPDSLRRSGRGMKELSPCSVSKEFTEEALLNSKRKKGKTVIQVTMESKRAELDPEVVGMKRKNLSAQKFKSLYKKQRIVPDDGDELDRSENLVGLCSDNGSDINSKPMEDTEDLEGSCLLCSKSKRVRYDSPEQELCSCSPMDEDLVRVADSSTNDVEELCGLCNKDGDLLSCEGKNCQNCYHLYCLDPPLSDALPGAWHCPRCVKKKLLLGVHSVSTGVESIWDVREVVVPNAEGAQQRQFLVKYRGLAHVHNHWVPETQLLLETPCRVFNFLVKDQDVRWNAKWMVPHRLLWKRPIQNITYVASTSVIWVCKYEWLVKWRDLDYDHATWELDNADFLSSPLGQDLVRKYEIRRGKAKSEANKPHMEPIIGHSEIPVGSHETHVMENVNKVRKFLLKGPCAVVIDDQERTTAIHFIDLMIETSRPFLIVATHDSLSRWEANFERLAPSVDVVVYSGSIDTRNVIRASEFYDEGGCMIVQVLLSSVKAVSEDLEILKSIKWKAIVIDEVQYSGIPEELEQIKMLSTDMRVVLVSGQIKDATSEYLKILSLVVPKGDFDKLRSLKSETNDDLCKLKERLSPFVVHGVTSQAPKFIEYWVPVQISNLQLEHYCATLLSHSNALCSRSRKDPFCVLQEVILTARKCCHHPYLVDPSVQACLIADKHPTHVVKDVGIKASGKLQLLDVMLSEIKTQGLRVLILYQLISLGQLSSESILLDFLFHRFGFDKYEHVDAAHNKSEKQAAADRFNNKTTGQFVFLLDNRACSPCIKLSSLDMVVIYDSDWNPANDLRALKKMSIDSKIERIKVLRLYSSFTIEERALLLAKQKLNPDHSWSNLSRSTSNTLLSWGAIYLFNKLDEYHADSNCSLALNLSGQLLLDKVTKEFQAILSENFINDSNSVITEAKSDDGIYSTNTLVFGESGVQLKDGEEHHVFWKNLLEGRNPPWKHLTGASPRHRKKVHYWEGSVDISEADKVNIAKKRQKMVNESLGPGISFVDMGPSATKSCHQSVSFHRDGQSSLDEVSVSAASMERIVPSDEQQSTHSVLQRGMKTLCHHLNLPDNVIWVAEKFLEYVIRNHHVSSNSTSIVQALQISLCWVAASITDQKVDKRESLMLAKQHMGFQCTEEEVSSVYIKMRSLKKVYLADSKKKKVYLECSDNGACLNNGAELEIGESSANKEHDEAGAKAMDEDDEMKIVQKKCDEHIQKLLLKHLERIEELERMWKDERDILETEKKLDSALIRSIHRQTPTGMARLNRLDVDFDNKIKDIDARKDAQRKKLLVEHLAVSNGCVQSPVQPSLQTEQTMIVPDSCEMLPQDTDAQHEENHTAPQVEIARSEPSNSVTPMPPNSESPITDDIVSPEASDKAPVDEVYGHLHSLAVDISLSCDQLPATEHHDQESSSPQTAEPEGTEVVLQQSISHAEENSELHPYHVSVVASNSNQPNEAVMENDVAVPQAMVSIAGQPNQTVPNPPTELATDAGNLRGPGFLLNLTRQPISSSDPLQIEIERIRKETEQLEKKRVDMMAQIKWDCEKEIEKITAQIRNKYDVKSRETDAEFRVKLNELDKNLYKVRLNKMLANAFRCKSSDAKPSRLQHRQGTSTSMLPPPSVRSSQPARSPTLAPARAHSQPTTSPAIQQLSRSHPMSSSPLAIQNATAHPIRGSQHAAARISGNLARPPVISVISPANPRASSETRGVLPHLQSCRPAVRASMSALPSSSTASQLQPLQISPKSPSLPQLPMVAQNSPEVRAELGAPTGFPNRGPYLSENQNASVPDIPSTFRSLEQSDLEMLGSTSLGNQTTAVEVEKGVVYLSGDE